MEKCSYLGCENLTEEVDDVEIAPGVIEKRPVCVEHTGTLVESITGCCEIYGTVNIEVSKEFVELQRTVLEAVNQIIKAARMLEAMKEAALKKDEKT